MQAFQNNGEHLNLKQSLVNRASSTVESSPAQLPGDSQNSIEDAERIGVTRMTASSRSQSVFHGITANTISAQSLALQAQDAYNATVNMQHQLIAQHNHQQQLIRRQHQQNEEQLHQSEITYDQQQTIIMHQHQLAHDSMMLQNQFYHHMYQLHDLLQQRQQTLFHYLRLAGIDPNNLVPIMEERR